MDERRPTPLASPHLEPEPGHRIGEYEVVEHLARGGMATVYAVRDVRTGETLALKLLQSVDRADETQARFRREFRALSRLHHANVLRVYEWGLHGARPWYTMELLEGHDLRHEAEALQAVDPAERYSRIRTILVEVARALAYVHDRGLVHRDVTPGNVMVLRDGAVKLMDFGVVKEEAGNEMTAVGELIGTVAFMAPEQITGEAVDARADLYSLGAVLYLLLTGKRPFTAHTIHGFMEKHLNVRPRPPRELDPTVPGELEEICLRLLEKAPQDRYASASHLLHVLGDAGSGDDLEDRWPPRTVGRTSLKARLREALDEIASGRKGQAVLLTGPLGQGKTRMLELAEQHARRLGLPVAIGRCRVADRPFGAFATVYRALRGEGPAQALLEQVFRASDDGRSWERYPILQAFRELVVDSAPLLLVLDDIDRADPATVELLVYLVRNTLELAGEPVLFLLGHDGTEHRIRDQVEVLPPVEAVELAPLGASEVEELVMSVIGSGPAASALAARLHEEGSGSPAFTADMLRGLVDDGLIVEDDTGVYRLTVDAASITRSQLPMPASLRQALTDRLAPLSPDAVALGRVLALSRRRLELDALVAAAPFPEDRVMEALDALVDAEIVVEARAGDREQVELSHGRFREVLAEGRAPDDLARGHRRLGEALERHHRGEIGQVVEELAHHFERAGLAPKAYQYLVSTAQRHLQRSLYQEALAFLDRAVAMEPQARPYMVLDDADRRLSEVHLAQSRARYGLGQLAEAVEAVTRAQALARLVRDPGLESRVAAELGTQLRQQGRRKEAEAQLVAAVQHAEQSGDHTLLPAPLYELGGLLWSTGDLASAEQHWKRCLQIAQQVGDERAQARGYNGLAILAICRGQSMDARRWLEQSATVFERLGMLGPLVIARTNLIELYSHTGVLRKALSLADRTLAQADEVGYPQGMALGRGWRSRVLLMLGRPDEAEREGLDCLRLVERLGNREDEAFALSNLVLVAFGKEASAEALARVEALLGVLAIHDHEGILPEAQAWHATALAGLGRVDEARAVLERQAARPELWPHVQVRVDLATGKALGLLGEPDRARSALQRALSASEANGFRYFQLAAHLALGQVVDDASVRDRHGRVAAGLGRSLAANLPKEDADRFLLAHGIAP